MNVIMIRESFIGKFVDKHEKHMKTGCTFHVHPDKVMEDGVVMRGITIRGEPAACEMARHAIEAFNTNKYGMVRIRPYFFIIIN